ncbi:hypothetical protein D3C80_1707830 [compost metagenome]
MPDRTTQRPAAVTGSLYFPAVLQTQRVQALHRNSVEAQAVDFVALLVLRDALFQRSFDQVEHPLGVTANVERLGRFEVRRNLDAPLGQRFSLAALDRQDNPAIQPWRPGRRGTGRQLDAVWLAANRIYLVICWTGEDVPQGPTHACRIGRRRPLPRHGVAGM